MGPIVARLMRGISDRLAPPQAPADFDADLYRGLHPDLAGLSAEAAARHYARAGAAEGRSRNLQALAAAQGPHLPQGYDLGAYRDANPDLLALADWDLLLHLVRHGVREGRRHRAFNPDLYRELNPHALGMSDDEAWLDFRDGGAACGRIGSGRELAQARGWPGGAWIDAIRPSEFRLLNWRWAGEADSIEAAAERLLEADAAHLASPSFHQRFDPAHVRETHPQVEGEDAALHRAWLFTDARRLAPGNADEHLRRLGLRLHAYPPAFDWRAHLAAHAEAGSTRWSALEHLVSSASDAAAPPCEGPGAADFLVAVGEAWVARSPERAAALVRAARERGLSGFDGLRRAADLSGRCGRWEDALELGAAAARHADADLATFVGGARAALALERPRDALALLAAGADRYGGAPRWSQAVAEAIAMEFDAALAAPNADGRAALARCRARWTEFPPPAAPAPAAADGRVALLVGAGPEAAARLRSWLRLLDALARPRTVHDPQDVDGFTSALPGCSAALFVDALADARVVGAIETARRLGVRTLHDSTGAGEGGSAARLADAPAGFCDLVVAATPAAAARLREVAGVGEVHLLPDVVEAGGTGGRVETARVRRNGRVAILHDAGADPDAFAASTAPLLRRALEASPDARLVLAGDAPVQGWPAELRSRVSHVTRMDPLAAFEDFVALLAEVDIHLESAVGATSAAGAVRRRAAALAGVPTLTGASASDERHVLALIGDADLRRALGEQARGEAERSTSTPVLAARLDALLPRAATGGARRPRILLVNVFFPPDTFGGATRVVQENLEAFLDDPAGAGLDFAVAATDFDPARPYDLRVGAHRGVPVFRFGAPDGPDRRAFNPDCGRVFDRILDAWAPDVVHFHCIQRITASAVEACAARGLPYVVTLHDAWWIHDHQFLLDEQGVLQDPRVQPPLRPTPGLSTGASLRRRRSLAGLLAGAERVLAVSESFARLHRDLGFERVQAVPNGAAPPTSRERTVSASGRVRLCHVGGGGWHKGLPLLRACLSQSHLPGLELTLLEPERVGGPELHEVWGATPVRRVGRRSQDGMADFYAGQDVLAAPSTWPESFGLVTREAIGAGLWVVAGDRGAIGEAVTPGVNGWVVDVSTPAGLASALGEVAADPGRYLSPPPQVATAPWAGADQARALLAVYREVLAEAARPRPTGGVSRPGRARGGGT